ncbi:hypothetical protein D3C72_2586340 [compost metagenome]
MAEHDPILPDAGQAAFTGGRVDFKALALSRARLDATAEQDREGRAHNGLGEKGVGFVHAG